MSGAMLHGLGDCTPTLHCGCLTPAVKEYVVGFALDNANRVALIRKNRPDWQKGLLNGVGGHVEFGEHPNRAMAREFREETGWEGDVAWGWPFVVMEFPGARIHFYRARVGDEVLTGLRTTTDEEVVVMWQDEVELPMVVPNLSWLLPLAAYTADTYETLYVRASVAEVLAGAVG